MSFDLDAYMKERLAAVDAALDRFLPPETERPETLHKAMRYSVFAGGKRLRPILVMAGAEAVGGSAEQVMPTACAMELIHTYSLVHDDLPAMDNDDFRRGVPTNHKVFGEATAILAGEIDARDRAADLPPRHATAADAVPPLVRSKEPVTSLEPHERPRGIEGQCLRLRHAGRIAFQFLRQLIDQVHGRLRILECQKHMGPSVDALIPDQVAVERLQRRASTETAYGAMAGISLITACPLIGA